MQAHDMPFTKLINVDQGAREHFHVPRYQREYTWKKWQWEQLLNDIEDNDPGYFMGSIICVNDAQAIAAGDEIIYQVVDGQQRLTTLSLLLAVIHSKLSASLADYEPLDEQDREEAQSCLTNIRAKLLKRKRDAKPAEPGAFKVGKNVYFLRVQPSVQNRNLADYLYLLGAAGLLDGQPKPAYCGNRLLARAYAYFEEKVPSAVTELLALMARINQLVFVQITVGSQADAFTLFESLNNRGVPLSAMDIIKNKLLAQMERKHEVDVEESFERWQGLIESIPEAVDQERFLRQFYNAYKHRKEIKVEKVTRATRSLIIRIYESIIDRDAAVLFDELTRSATVYGKLLRSEFSPKPVAAALTEMERISSAPAYLVLLYLFSLDASELEDSNFLKRVVELLARYFIRRNVTDKPPTRQIDQALIDLVEACATRVKSGKKLTYDWFVSELMKHARPASYEEFKIALAGSINSTDCTIRRSMRQTFGLEMRKAGLSGPSSTSSLKLRGYQSIGLKWLAEAIAELRPKCRISGYTAWAILRSAGITRTLQRQPSRGNRDSPKIAHFWGTRSTLGTRMVSRSTRSRLRRPTENSAWRTRRLGMRK